MIEKNVGESAGGLLYQRIWEIQENSGNLQSEHPVLLSSSKPRAPRI
jgi:hypothetical protein